MHNGFVHIVCKSGRNRVIYLVFILANCNYCIGQPDWFEKLEVSRVHADLLLQGSNEAKLSNGSDYSQLLNLYHRCKSQSDSLDLVLLQKVATACDSEPSSCCLSIKLLAQLCRNQTNEELRQEISRQFDEVENETKCLTGGDVQFYYMVQRTLKAYSDTLSMIYVWAIEENLKRSIFAGFVEEGRFSEVAERRIEPWMFNSIRCKYKRYGEGKLAPLDSILNSLKVDLKTACQSEDILNKIHGSYPVGIRYELVSFVDYELYRVVDRSEGRIRIFETLSFLKATNSVCKQDGITIPCSIMHKAVPF